MREPGASTPGLETPPHPSISSDLPLPCTFPITSLILPFLSPALQAQSIAGQRQETLDNFFALSVKDMTAARSEDCPWILPQDPVPSSTSSLEGSWIQSIPHKNAEVLAEPTLSSRLQC